MEENKPEDKSKPGLESKQRAWLAYAGDETDAQQEIDEPKPAAATNHGLETCEP
jgi:uncharacterized protein YecT (DUF1311 family)